MPVKWDDSLEKALLLRVIHQIQPSNASINWDIVAESMGSDFTGVACKEKIKKMKAAAKAQFGEPAAPAANGDAPKTPASKAKGGRKKADGESTAKSTGKRKKAADEAEETNGDDEESLTKKVKSEEAEKDGLV